MPQPTNLVLQQKYAKNALIAMSVQKPMGLAKQCEKGDPTSGESYTFYRAEGSTAKDGLPSMYNSSDKGYEGDAGSNGGDAGPLKPYKCEGSFISSQHKIGEIEFQKTSLKAKGTLQKTMAIALAQREDLKIMGAIKGKDGELDKSANATVGIDNDKVMRSLVGRIAVAHARAKMTPDGQKGVAVVINIKDWEVLVATDFYLKDEFKDSIVWGDNETPTKIRGAEFLITEDDAMTPSGTMYIVPSNTCGYANWKGMETAVAEYHETDSSRWHLQNKKYMGAICIEPKYITKFTFKAVSAVA